MEMPVMDSGAMAVRMLLQDAGLERIPIVLLSGGVDLPRVAREIGTPYYLAKPVGPAGLLRVLEDRALVRSTRSRARVVSVRASARPHLVARRSETRMKNVRTSSHRAASRGHPQ
jgi:CheY-like chemotaxis protein